jgi:CheY-like chemotaxis protein
VLKASGKTVLIVDDEHAARNVVAEVVERRGHKVLKAPDGEWALRLLDTHPEVNLVILDVKMPKVNGLEVVRKIRAGSRPKLPVILMTAETRDLAVRQGYASGADYFVTKPLKPERLLKIVDYLIGDLTEAERKLLDLQL